MELQQPSSLSEPAEPVLNETGGKDIIGSTADRYQLKVKLNGLCHQWPILDHLNPDK